MQRRRRYRAMVAALQKMICAILKCCIAEMKYGRNCSGTRRAYAKPCEATRGFAPFFANTKKCAERYWTKKIKRQPFLPKWAIIVMPQAMRMI